MDFLKLCIPSPALEAQAMEYKAEHFLAGEEELHGGALLEKLAYTAWLSMVDANRSPSTANPNWVVADTFFVIRASDNRIVGMVDIRHTLNDFLAAYGGHIGYGVRPSERRKGYATGILRLALQYAKETIGLTRVMVACYADNEGSWRTIQRCGGRLTRTFIHTDGRTVQVYWIDLVEPSL